MLSNFCISPSFVALLSSLWIDLTLFSSALISKSTRSPLHLLFLLSLSSLLGIQVRQICLIETNITFSIFSAVDQYDSSTIRMVFSGAAPLGAALSKQVMNFSNFFTIVRLIASVSRFHRGCRQNAKRKDRSTSSRVPSAL